MVHVHARGLGRTNEVVDRVDHFPAPRRLDGDERGKGLQSHRPSLCGRAEVLFVGLVQFKKGHTIAVLKAFLEDEYDLKQEQTVRAVACCTKGSCWGKLVADTCTVRAATLPERGHAAGPVLLDRLPCVLEASAIDIQVRRSGSGDAKSRK